MPTQRNFVDRGIYPQYLTGVPGSHEVWAYKDHEIEVSPTTRDGATVWQATVSVDGMERSWLVQADKQGALAGAKSFVDLDDWLEAHPEIRGDRIHTELTSQATRATSREDLGRRFAQLCERRRQRRGDTSVCDDFESLPLDDRLEFLDDIWAEEERFREYHQAVGSPRYGYRAVPNKARLMR